MGQTNMLCEGTIQCTLGMGLANVLYEWNYPMCPGNWGSYLVLQTPIVIKCVGVLFIQ